MTARRVGPASAALLAVLALVGPVPADAADLAEADAAFTAGDHVRALALYEDVLRGSPDALLALVRSGMLLSWDERYDEAISRYDRALRAEPGDPLVRLAAVERAKVLSWAGRHAQAAEAFRQVLLRDPGSREARLGLARTLSWSGRQAEARREYAVLLERDPRDAEALVGTAQTHAWAGDLVRARRLYAQALDVAPGMREAELGLGYAELWSGRTAAAARLGEGLASRHPSDAEVAAFRREVAGERAPHVRAGAERLDDTDDTTMETLRLEAGWGLAPGVDLGLSAARHALRHPLAGNGTIEAIHVTAAWHPTPGQRLFGRVGTERLEPPAGETDRVTSGGLAWTWGLGGPWQVAAGWDREPFRYSPEILAHRVIVDSWRLRVDGRPAARWRVAGGWARGDLEGRDAVGEVEENRRQSLDAGAWYRRGLGRTTGEVGYVLRALDHDRDLDQGYFDPQDFRSHVVQARAYGPWGGTRATWDLTLEGGVQSFTLGPDRVRNDGVLGASALVRVPLGDALALEATASATDYALQSASGFRSRSSGLFLRWRLGASP